MSCPPTAYSAYGRRGIGVIQPQSGLDYPFVQPSDDVRYLIADFYLAYEDDTTITFPLRISQITGAACVTNGDRVDVVVVDAAGHVVINTAAVTDPVTEYAAEDWVTDNVVIYRIYTWQTASVVCRMAVYAAWTAADPDERVFDDPLMPDNAILDARTTYKMPKRLRSISVRQLSGPAVAGPYKGNITFVNKYNTELVAAAQTANNFRLNTKVTLSASSGSGFGYYPRCDDGTANSNLAGVPIKTINGVAPNEYGDFFVSATDCLYARRPTVLAGNQLHPLVNPTTQSNDVLKMGADCSPCCKCDDYYNVATHMNYVADRYRLIGARVVNSVKTIHQQNVLKWSDQRACSINNPIKLLMVPQRCPYMDFVLMLCNPCRECLPGSTLTLQLATVPYNELATAELVCGHTAMFAPDIDGRPVPIDAHLDAPENMWLAVKFPALKLGASAYVKLRLKFSDKSPYAVSGSLTGVLDAPYSTPIQSGCDNETPEEDRFTAIAQATQAVYCNDDGLTEMPC
jgi:hypothetical protein